ncbi:MAG: hypothetical protein JNG88_17640 [Phycisphaerales bacterium]|nr:hypothetical protein [Phycisphaerales bacterium]
MHWRIDFRQYDEWNRPSIAPIDVDPLTTEFAGNPSVGSYGEYACVSWYKDGIIRARLFDGIGAPTTDPFVVFDAVQGVNSLPHILMDADRIVFTLSIDIAGQRGVFVRAFDYQGAPQTGLIPVAISPAGSPRKNGRAGFLTSGGMSVIFTRGSGSTEPWLPYLAALDSTYQVINIAQLAEVSTNYNGFGVLDDGSIGIILGTFDEPQTAFAERFDEFGQPSGNLVNVDPSELYISTHIRPDGAFVLAFRVNGDEVRGRLYSQDWQPFTEQFQLPLFYTTPPYDFGSIRSAPGLIAENGDAWFTWDNTLIPRQAYLAVLKPLLRGDMNNDKRIDNFDIDPFVLALTDPAAYSVQYNIPQAAGLIIGDINEDGFLNNFDIDPFVSLLAEE